MVYEPITNSFAVNPITKDGKVTSLSYPNTEGVVIVKKPDEGVVYPQKSTDNVPFTVPTNGVVVLKSTSSTPAELLDASGKPVPGGKTDTDSSGKPVITYANLPPGSYTPNGGITFMPEQPKQNGEVPVGGKPYLIVLSTPDTKPSNVQVKICEHKTTGTTPTTTSGSTSPTTTTSGTTSPTSTTSGPPTCWNVWGSWTTCGTGCRPNPSSRLRTRTCSTKPGCADSCHGGTTGTELNCDTNCTSTPVCGEFMKLPTTCSELCDSCAGYILGAACNEVQCSLTERCVCEDGYKMEDGKCVKTEECGCYGEDGNKRTIGQEYPSPGKPCEKCMCNNKNKFVCSPKADCCDWTEWQPWSAECNPKCGKDVSATRSRTRVSQNSNTCTKSPQTVTMACTVPECDCLYQNQTLSSGEDIIKDCYNVTCDNGNATKTNKPPVHGTYGPWSEWSVCDKMCRDHQKTRVRTCEGIECGGMNCVNGQTDEQKAPCDATAECCEPKWEAWSNCSKVCYGPGETKGIRTRKYTWTNPDDKACAKPVTGESDECGEPCECDRYDWTPWQTCDEKCGYVNVSRSRNTMGDPNCANLPTKEYRQCYSRNCNCTKENEVYSNHTLCEMTCADRSIEENCKSTISSGCKCAEGTFRNNNTCVKMEDCMACYKFGKKHEDGAVFEDPNDPCMKYRCVAGAGVEVNNCTKTCDNATEDMVLNPEGSCCIFTCKKKTCQPSSEKVFISVESCNPRFEVDQYSCKGDCGKSEAKYDVTMKNAMVKDCKCCVPVDTRKLNYTVPCEPNSPVQRQTVTVVKIETCKCNQCP